MNVWQTSYAAVTQDCRFVWSFRFCEASEPANTFCVRHRYWVELSASVELFSRVSKCLGTAALSLWNTVYKATRAIAKRMITKIRRKVYPGKSESQQMVWLLIAIYKSRSCLRYFSGQACDFVFQPTQAKRICLLPVLFYLSLIIGSRGKYPTWQSW